eukprot:XP_012818895.2 PREDICTED: leucine-, glutamate- and lysine-rich protein 1 isoform X2 [Xenopus tropicalis]
MLCSCAEWSPPTTGLSALHASCLCAWACVIRQAVPAAHCMHFVLPHSCPLSPFPVLGGRGENSSLHLQPCMAPSVNPMSQIVKDMDRHIPMHPLPEEIQKMPRDETVCKYCGVSYLILHEFKLLEEKMKMMEKELKFYQGSMERENQLQDDLRHLRQELEQNKTDIEFKTERLRIACVQLQKREEELEILTKELRNYKEEVKAAHNQLQILGKETTKQRSYLAETMSLLRSLQLEQTAIKNVTNDTLVKWISVRKELNAQVEEISRSHTADLQQQKETAQLNLLNLTKESNQQKETALTKSKEMNDLLTRLRRMEYDKDTAELRLTKELKEKEDSLAQFQEKGLQLQEVLAEKERAEENCKRRTQRLESELETLKEVLKQSQEEIAALQHERELKFVSYQNRIEQLQDALRQRILSNDSRDAKLEAELENERNKYLRKLEETEQKYKEEASVELNIERQKNEELIKKLQKQQQELEEKIPMLICQASEELTIEINLLEKKLQEAQTRLAERDQAKESETGNLKKMISELEHSLKREQNKNNFVLEEARSELYVKSEKLNELTQNIDELRLQLDKVIQENSFLKETVRLECEERYELTEALTQAREQLIELKRVNGSLSLSQRTFHSDKAVLSSTLASPGQKHSLGISSTVPAKLTSLLGSYAPGTGITSSMNRHGQSGHRSFPLLPSPPPAKERAASVTDVRQTITAVLRRNSTQL